jgi:hypothetical protein
MEAVEGSGGGQRVWKRSKGLEVVVERLDRVKNAVEKKAEGGGGEVGRRKAARRCYQGNSC